MTILNEAIVAKLIFFCFILVEYMGKKEFEDTLANSPETFNDSNIKLEMEQELLQRNDSWQSASTTTSASDLK